PADGLAVLEDALATQAETGEHSYEADLHRLKGELLLLSGARRTRRKGAIETVAEESLEQAFAIGRRQGARSFELRAATSLTRLREAQGAPAAARRLLAEVYGRFSEGFETADLAAARTILEARS